MITRRLLQEVTKAEQRAFARQIFKLIKQTHTLEENKVKGMVRLLKLAGADIQSRMLDMADGTFSRAMASQIKQSVNSLLARFSQQATDRMVMTHGDFAKLAGNYLERQVRAQGEVPPLLQVHPDLLENAATRSADLIRSLSARQLAVANDILNVGVITGKSTFEVAQELADRFDKGIAQMETIARTELLGIHSQVEFAGMQQMAEEYDNLEKTWLSTIDGRQRPAHEEAHEQTVPVNDPFIVDEEELDFPRDPKGSAGNIINCVPAGTVVQGTFVGATRARYSGSIVEVRTRAGNRLSATPNHPAVIDGGIVPFGLLRPGYKLVRYASSVKPAMDAHHYDTPARIEDAFHALAKTGSMVMARRLVNFDGDVAGMQGQVDIVGPACLLLDHKNPTLSQGRCNSVLADATTHQKRLRNSRPKRELCSGAFHPTHGIPGLGALTLHEATVLFQGIPLDALRLGSASRLNSGLYKPTAYKLSRHTGASSQRLLGKPLPIEPQRLRVERDQGAMASKIGEAGGPHRFAQVLHANPDFARQLSHANPGTITLDEIVHVEIRRYDGFVYDLFSPHGWMVANGLLESQCRCTMILDMSKAQGAENRRAEEYPLINSDEFEKIVAEVGGTQESVDDVLIAAGFSSGFKIDD